MHTAINHLLSPPRASRVDQMGLLAAFEPCALHRSQVLALPGTSGEHVYFPLDCVIALTCGRQGSSSVQIGMIGCEGMLGIPLVLGVATQQLHAEVQGPGQALRMAAGTFRDELARRPALGAKLHQYIAVRMVQMANAAWCASFHAIEPRLARWLLMFQDRCGAANFRATHDELASRLGVRRVGVTVAASALQRAGLIAYHRGAMQILDRPGLEAAACSCYAADNDAYRNGLT